MIGHPVWCTPRETDRVYSLRAAGDYGNFSDESVTWKWAVNECFFKYYIS